MEYGLFFSSPATPAPSTSQLNHTTTVTVDVADGALTVDAVGGTNTKVDYLQIQPATTGPTQVTVPFSVNYQTQTTATPSGYVGDYGLQYTSTAGVGFGMKPPVYLKVGDTMRLGISGLGEQEQAVVTFGSDG